MERTGVHPVENARQECYRLLAACFYQPEKEIHDADFFTALAENLDCICPAALPAAADMQVAFAACPEEELNIEYAKLFVGPFELKAPPYGSVYLDPGRAVMGESTGNVHAFYLSCGLKLANDFHELPDHIAVELEFMSFLIQRQTAALAAAEPGEAARFALLQENFLENYLLPWVGSFCAAIRANCDNLFYRSLADVVEKMARADHARFAVHPTGGH